MVLSNILPVIKSIATKYPPRPFSFINAARHEWGQSKIDRQIVKPRIQYPGLNATVRGHDLPIIRARLTSCSARSDRLPLSFGQWVPTERDGKSGYASTDNQVSQGGNSTILPLLPDIGMYVCMYVLAISFLFVLPFVPQPRKRQENYQQHCDQNSRS
ncbi:hypothetical protein F5X96DRAFT_11614 [Biscogniauxia mediterranea]|nr:hypothetical protein F5X96DRAFT_11614 [Biscogniauxia mediterranea]